VKADFAGSDKLLNVSGDLKSNILSVHQKRVEKTHGLVEALLQTEELRLRIDKIESAYLEIGTEMGEARIKAIREAGRQSSSFLPETSGLSNKEALFTFILSTFCITCLLVSIIGNTPNYYIPFAYGGGLSGFATIILMITKLSIKKFLIQSVIYSLMIVGALFVFFTIKYSLKFDISSFTASLMIVQVAGVFTLLTAKVIKSRSKKKTFL
jgi:hypothetical protein